MESQKLGKVLSFKAHKRWLKHYMHKPFRRQLCPCSILLATVDKNLVGSNRIAQVQKAQVVPTLPEFATTTPIASLGGFKRKQARKQKADERKLKFKLFFENMCDCHISDKKLKFCCFALALFLVSFFLSIPGAIFFGIAPVFILGSSVGAVLISTYVLYILAKSGKQKYSHRPECSHYMTIPPHPQKSA